MRLTGRVAIVTGGGGGIGEGICRCLAREGADVVVSDLDANLADRVASEVKVDGRRALSVKTDVRKAADCQALIDTTLKEMGKIDILVCSAGVSGIRLNSDVPDVIENLSEEDWDLTIDVNLKGVFLCNRAVAPIFKEQRSGKIVNISSMGGRRGTEILAHYCASKAGVIVFSQSVALQLAPFNVNVNTICPGMIYTPLWKYAAHALSFSIPQLKEMDEKEAFHAQARSVIPLRRPQTAEDIGNAVVFLASAEAENITGQALNVDGGVIFS